MVQTFLSDWAGAMRKTVIRIRNEVHYAWPLAEPTRTMAELCALAGRLQTRRAARENKAAKPARRQRSSQRIVPPCSLRQNKAATPAR